MISYGGGRGSHAPKLKCYSVYGQALVGLWILAISTHKVPLKQFLLLYLRWSLFQTDPAGSPHDLYSFNSYPYPGPPPYISFRQSDTRLSSFPSFGSTERGKYSSDRVILHPRHKLSPSFHKDSSTCSVILNVLPASAQRGASCNWSSSGPDESIGPRWLQCPCPALSWDT